MNSPFTDAKTVWNFATSAGNVEAGMVRGPQHTEVLRSMLLPWACKKEWKEHLLPWLLHQHLPALCGSTPCTPAPAGAAVRLPRCRSAGGPWEAYWLLQRSGTSIMHSACVHASLIIVVWGSICKKTYNSVSKWCSLILLTALRSSSWRRDRKIGNSRGQGISAPPVTGAFKNPISTAHWIARWLTQTNKQWLFTVLCVFI